MVTGNRIVPCRLGFYGNGRHRTRLAPEKGAHAVRTGAVLLPKYSPPPDRRSTRRGCDTCSPRVRICAEAVMPEVLRLGGHSVMLCSTVTSHEIRGPSHAHHSTGNRRHRRRTGGAERGPGS